MAWGRFSSLPRELGKKAGWKARPTNQDPLLKPRCSVRDRLFADQGESSCRSKISSRLIFTQYSKESLLTSLKYSGVRSPWR